MDKVGRLNAIIEMLRSSSSRLQKIFIQKEKGPARIAEVIRLARESGVQYVFVPRCRLDLMEPRNQGAVALVAAKAYASLEEILAAAGNPFLVLLDEVEDPQNLGAIIRTAECAGADGLILPERRSAGLTQTVLTISAGAVEHLPVSRVTNLGRAMEELKERGLWLVGTEPGHQEMWFEFDYTGPTGIVLGSEGRGLRRLIREKCDRLLSVPLFGRVNSLNVSAAAAVFLFEVARQRLLKKK